LLQAYHAYGIPGRQMLRAGNVVAGKRLIGHFKCDLGTIFAAPGKIASSLSKFWANFTNAWSAIRAQIHLV